MSSFQALIYGLIQGLTEFLPVSSSAHLALIPKFLTIEDPGVEFDLLMHLGTAFAVIIFFRNDLWNLSRTFLGLLLNPTKTKEQSDYFCLSLIGATVLTACLAFMGKSYAATWGRGTLFIGVNLIFFGALLVMSEKSLLKRANPINQWSLGATKKALIIGLAQALAIFPGVSRSGITLTCALFLGIDKNMATRFSFLLSLPIILGGALLLLPDYFQSTTTISFSNGLIGFVSSFVVGIGAIHFFLSWIQKRSLWSFFVYRVILAIFCLAIFG